ncbi:MAG: hypothetical protein M3174_00235 [Actinomycetota bacterium]|nr:hypothetical protein [Actinomycetota bacterium]
MESHLRQTYVKLNIRSRDDLAVAMQAVGREISQP